jgi:hypothetical protein
MTQCKAKSAESKIEVTFHCNFRLLSDARGDRLRSGGRRR